MTNPLPPASRSGARNRRLYLPAYRLADAARLVGTTAPTIARWYRGYRVPGHRMKPVLPSSDGPRLSYLQLVEVAFIASFRQQGVKLDALRRAHEYCRQALNAEYPFAELSFKTDGVHLFHALAEHEGTWERAERLVVTDQAGQLVWREAIRDRLEQFDYVGGLALRWHPRGRRSVILVDPRIAFGAPIIGDTGVPTWAVKERVQAGETLAEIEEDFGVPQPLLVDALAFERVAIPTAA